MRLLSPVTHSHSEVKCFSLLAAFSVLCSLGRLSFQVGQQAENIETPKLPTQFIQKPRRRCRQAFPIQSSCTWLSLSSCCFQGFRDATAFLLCLCNCPFQSKCEILDKEGDSVYGSCWNIYLLRKHLRFPSVTLDLSYWLSSPLH